MALSAGGVRGGLIPLRAPRARSGRRAAGRARAEGGDTGGGPAGGAGDGEAAAPAEAPSPGVAALQVESDALPSNYCIIDGPETVQDFAAMELAEVRRSIEGRRNKIFLLMEEVRRLRIQERFKSGDARPERPQREFNSAIPGLPQLTAATIDQYYTAWGVTMVGLLLFGGVLAPLVELKLGLGGTSYSEFISSIGLPSTLGKVDPIVASFTGGAVGVITSLLFVEVNNVEEQARSDCVYCKGKGYLSCVACASTGKLVDPVACADGTHTVQFCGTCTGTGKVMCVSCLSTGRALVSEHDPRIDPFGE